MTLSELRAGRSLTDTSVVEHQDLGRHIAQTPLAQFPEKPGRTQRPGSSDSISFCVSVFHNITYLIHC